MAADIAKICVDIYEIKVLQRETYLFFCKDDNTQQLILKTLHGDSEVNDWSPGWDLRSIGRVTQLCGHVHTETFHYIYLLVTHFHLETEEKFNYDYIYCVFIQGSYENWWCVAVLFIWPYLTFQFSNNNIKWKQSN